MNVYEALFNILDRNTKKSSQFYMGAFIFAYFMQSTRQLVRFFVLFIGDVFITSAAIEDAPVADSAQSINRKAVV